MFGIELRDNEITILKLRNDGYSYRECAKKLGFKHYQQAVHLYKTTLKKMREWSDLTSHYPEFVITAHNFGKTQRWLLVFYKFMKKNNLLYQWKRMSDEELKAIPGFGRDYLWFIRALRQSAK